MTPEERWEHIEQTVARIDKRHESIAQIIEDIRRMQRSSEARSGRCDERLASYDELFAQNEVRLAQLMETMKRLDNLENR